jgi:curved DNA-binding protein
LSREQGALLLSHDAHYDGDVTTTNHRDYYELLGIGHDATEQEIREAYRKLAFQYHPDRNKDSPDATEKMKAINEAYATLSDRTKRSDYDILRQRYGADAYAQYRQTHTQEDIFRGSDIDQIFEEFSKSFGFRSADDIFRQFYGPGFQGYVYSRPGFTFRSYVFTPGRTDDAPQRPDEVPTTPPGLTGRTLRFFLEKVLKIPIPARGKDIVDTLHVAPGVARLGGEVRYEYNRSGRPRTLAIKVPAGTQDGQRIRLHEMGLPGKAGGSPGDLFLKVSVKVSLLQRVKSIFKS